MSAILDSKTLQDVTNALAANERYLKPPHISAALNMLPKISYPPASQPAFDQLLGMLLDDICSRISTLNTHSVVSVIWAIAKLNATQHQDTISTLLQELMVNRLVDLEASSPRLTTLCWSLGTLNRRDDDIWHHLLSSCLQLVPNFTPLDCAQLSVGLARLHQQSPQHRRQHQQLRQELLDAITERAKAILQDCMPQNTANLLWALASLHHPAPGLCQRVSEHLDDWQLYAYKPQELCSLAWGYVRLTSLQQQQSIMPSNISQGDDGEDASDHASDWLDDAAQMALASSPSSSPPASSSTSSSTASTHYRFCSALTSEAASRGVHSFRSEELVMLSWALANLGQQHCPVDFLDQIAEVAISRRSQLQLKEMCCITWALASLGHHRQDMLQHLIPHALPKITAETQEVSLQLMFACAKAQQASPELCAAWKAAALPRLATTAPKHLAIGLWSLAQLASLDEATFRAASRTAQRHVPGCAPAYLNLLASAVGTAEVSEPLLMLAMANEVKGRLVGLPADAASMVVWAAARTGFYCEELCDMVAAATAEGGAAAGWDAHTLSTLAWALASSRHYSSQFLNSLAAHVAAHMEAYTWADLCRVAYAFAVLQHHNPPLLAAIAQAALQRQASIDAQGGCIMAWALATLGHVDAALFRVCYAFYEQRFAQAGGVLGPGDDWAAQLFHADMMAQLLLQQQQGEELPTLSPALQQACFASWRRWQRQLHISDLQQQVAQALSSLGLTPLLECPAHRGLLSVDVLLCLKGGERVAVEVDGPDHFAANVQSHVLGPTAAKARSLRALGYTVVTVPYFEWDALGGWQARREYLVAKLKGRRGRGGGGGGLPGGFVSREVVSRRGAV